MTCPDCGKELVQTGYSGGGYDDDPAIVLPDIPDNAFGRRAWVCGCFITMKEAGMEDGQ